MAGTGTRVDTPKAFAPNGGASAKDPLPRFRRNNTVGVGSMADPSYQGNPWLRRNDAIGVIGAWHPTSIENYFAKGAYILEKS